MSRISRNISIILRAERLIAQRQVAVAAKRTGIYAAAGLAVGLAAVMLNVAGFFWLSETLSTTSAALIVAGIDLVVAVLLAVVANSMTAQTDTSDAVELRDMALQDIETEIRENFADARNAVTGIRRDPLGTLTPEIVSALLGVLLKYAKTRKKPQD
ncbi:phage holin family protein [Ruegeria lacuscaerulensis]|uniref:phage holin family protein n=1 Tax=Ruegeria lacuscaerulensis TaxID=55218 RepID=UPI00147FBCCE|nr:phage holin family protein [Ruegeria lacuscaerulensis]